LTLLQLCSRASAEKFPGGGGNVKKTKNSKKDQKIALSSLFQGWWGVATKANMEKYQKIAKKIEK